MDAIGYPLVQNQSYFCDLIKKIFFSQENKILNQLFYKQIVYTQQIFISRHRDCKIHLENISAHRCPDSGKEDEEKRIKKSRLR